MPSLGPRRWLAVALVPVLVTAPLAGAPAVRAASVEPTVALMVVPAPDLSPRLALALREALAARIEAAGLRPSAGAPRRDLERTTVEALREGLVAGRAAYQALDAGAAQARLDAVTAAVEADPRLAAAQPDLVEAPILLGVVALGLGDAEGADRAFQRALRLAPDLTLPPGRFSPSVEHALALARVRLTALRPARLRLYAVPTGVDLFVDGVHRGRMPLALEPLAPGPHVLVAQTPAGTSVASAIDATEFAPDVLEVVVPVGAVGPSLVALARSLSAADARPEIAPGAAGALADALGAPRLALVWLEGTPTGLAAAAALLDLSAGDALATLDLDESPDVAQAAERLGGWLAAAARGEAPARKPRLLPDWRTPDAAGTQRPTAELTAPAPVPAATEPQEAARSWYRQWYWWALIGVGMAAGAAALASSGGGGGAQTGSVSVGQPAQ